MIQVNIDQLKQQFQDLQILNLQNIIEHKQNQSEFLQQYLIFFGKAYTPIIRPQNNFLQQLKSHNILYDNQQFFYSTPLVKIANNSLRYQFLTIEVKLGYFTFYDINIGNINAVFPAKLANPEGWGSFGSVYKIIFRDQQLALKVTFLSLTCQSNRAYLRDLNLKTQLILKEFCLSKLASALGVGPTICGKMGFDILFYKDCIAYPMQYCQNENYDQTFQCSQNRLKEKLLIMHSFKFIHLDLKDNNICYSKTRKQFVFIDYGLSIIISQKLGEKTFTKYFGTANYCSEAMSKLMTVQQGGLVDLYHNDVCCLQKVFNLEKSESWRKNRQSINVDHLYKKEQANWDDYDLYEKAIMASYLKFLVYKLQLSQFELLMQSKMRLLKTLDLVNVFNFIKSISFSSKFLTIYPQIVSFSTNLSMETQAQIHITFSDDQDQTHGKCILDMIESLNNKDSKHEHKRLLRSINDREILLKERQIQKLNYKIYIRLLLQVIQINVNSSSLKQKNYYCSFAKKIFQKMEGQIYRVFSIVENNSRKKQLGFNDFQMISLVLFFYSLLGKIDSVKISAFHSMIYNVVLLQLLDLESLLQCYRLIQKIRMSFHKKMHMILKFKTTLHWKYYQVRYSFNQRAHMIQRIKELDQKFQQETYRTLSEKEYQFMKIINFSAITIPRRKRIILAENILNQLLQGDFSEFFIDMDFKSQLIMWFICNIVRVDSNSIRKTTMQNFIFQKFNQKQVSFQYYHFSYLFFPNGQIFNMNQSNWIIDLFLKVFQDTQISSFYQLDYFRQILYLKKSFYKNYQEFLYLIKDLNLSKINPDSLFGTTLSQSLAQIIQHKSLISLPLQVQHIYSQRYMGKLLTYEYILYEQVAPLSIITVLIKMLKQQMYTCRILCDMEKVDLSLRPKFREIYLNLSKSIKEMKSKDNMNYALIGLMTINVYILFRNKQFRQMMDIMIYVFICFDKLNGFKQIQTFFQPFIYFFFLRIVSCNPIKRFFVKGQYLPIYKQFYKHLKRKHLHRRLFDCEFILMDFFTFILHDHSSELADFINMLSYEVLKVNSYRDKIIYFGAIQKLYLCGQFRTVLEKVNTKYVFPRLQDTSVNPYNAIYLHFSMRYPKLWSHKRIVQICKGLNLVDKNVSKLIRSEYYKYYIMFYRRKLTQRKKASLFFQDAKHNNQLSNENPGVHILRPFINSKSWQALKCSNLQKNFGYIKSKLLTYLFENKKQKNHTGGNQQEEIRKIGIRMNKFNRNIGKLNSENTIQT